MSVQFTFVENLCINTTSHASNKGLLEYDLTCLKERFTYCEAKLPNVSDSIQVQIIAYLLLAWHQYQIMS